jgi:hypothetical protein
MPVDILPFFSAATVLATPTPDGGVRSLAIGMTLHRLISSAVLQRVTPAACEYLAPHQEAVGVKPGCDLIVHAIRAALEEHGANDEYVLVRVDARNSFNAVKRAKMLDAVVQHVPALSRLVYAIYGQPPLLRACHCIFKSLEDTQQGCALPMLLFNLAIQPSVMDSTSVYELRVNLWETDAGTLFGRISEVAKALEIIRGAEDDTGYLMRLDKTRHENMP